MSFKVKATVVAFLGDPKKYPCHFQHQIGEEFIYDGEKFIGRLCPSITSYVIPQMMAVHAAGPRHIARPAYYYPFWYAPLSVDAPELKKYDGLGFRNDLDRPTDPDDPIPKLVPPGAFEWPPRETRDVSKAPSVVCPDIRTAVVMRIEAFDLSENGYDPPYFRRQMMILYKVMQKPGIAADAIINEFTKKESEEIYPALSPVMMTALCEELELMEFLSVKDGKATVTDKGRARFAAFKASLKPEETAALGIKR
jgi:uncharacterized repeat protein (TIGR04076 family)